MNELTEGQQEWIEDARAMIDWLAEHPDFIYAYRGLEVGTHCHTKDEFAGMVRDLGSATKDPAGDYMVVRKFFGVHQVSAQTHREQVCEKVQVGTRPVERIDPTYLKDAPKVTVEEPIFEWKCGSILAEDAVPA